MLEDGPEIILEVLGATALEDSQPELISTSIAVRLEG